MGFKLIRIFKIFILVVWGVDCFLRENSSSLIRLELNLVLLIYLLIKLIWLVRVWKIELWIVLFLVFFNKFKKKFFKLSVNYDLVIFFEWMCK